MVSLVKDRSSIRKGDAIVFINVLKPGRGAPTEEFAAVTLGLEGVVKVVSGIGAACIDGAWILAGEAEVVAAAGEAAGGALGSGAYIRIIHTNKQQIIKNADGGSSQLFLRDLDSKVRDSQAMWLKSWEHSHVIAAC